MWDSYIAGVGLRFEGGRYEPASSWESILDSGDMCRVVRDTCWKNGLFYGIDGRSILRAFHFNEVRSGVWNKSYDFDKLVPWLRKQKGITNLNIVSIPYYNVTEDGDLGIEFDFTPSSQLFGKMRKMLGKSLFDAEEMIRAHLKIAKFRTKKGF